jgi:hypothetical protein
MRIDQLAPRAVMEAYDEGPLFGRLRRGRGGVVEYIMKQLEHPDHE